MTRTCSYCDKPMGYKCHVCNESLHPLKEVEDEMYGHCPKCNEYQELEAGGTTHGICDDCIEKEKEKVSMSHISFRREFSMPNKRTFDMKPVARLLFQYLAECRTTVDPFAGDSAVATLTNDLNPDTRAGSHMLADGWLDGLIEDGVKAQAVLFDPPYSPRQISEVYKNVGLEVGMRETQNGRLYKSVKDKLDKILIPGGIAICCGWNSMGFGKTRGYKLIEVMLVPHGGAHNDTIVTVEMKKEEVR